MWSCPAAHSRRKKAATADFQERGLRDLLPARSPPLVLTLAVLAARRTGDLAQGESGNERAAKSIDTSLNGRQT